MKEFKTTLLREKFTILDSKQDVEGDLNPVTAMSNRLPLSLFNNQGEIVERFIIRSHNMHSCVRMGARILRSYEERGSLMNRSSNFNWAGVWGVLMNDYEEKYHPDHWLNIYHDGQAIFKEGQAHPFLDVIEKCDASNNDDYDKSILLAEKAFEKTGTKVRIDYDGNVALAVHFEDGNVRCGVILRGPERTTTFTFTASPKEIQEQFFYSQCLSASAAFLEGIQMSFLIGMINEKLRRGLVQTSSDEDKQRYAAKDRVRRLSSEIANFEAVADVRFRPERPEFDGIILDTEQIASQIFDAQDII